MASQVFYRKWRPQNLAGVIGQEPVTHTLLNALSSGRISHAYLFCGPRGTGKTSTARILAKAVNCLTNGKGEPCNACDMCRAIADGRALDVIEIDAASHTKVEEMRDVIEKVVYAPNQARYKVYIIDEVHMLSNSASNALLKTLEEPPPHVIFILATTEVHKILPTIMSRCQRFDFRRLTQANIITELTLVCEGEGIKIEPAAMQLLARSATGSMRDALNLLEQLTAYYGSEVGLQQAQTMLGITGDWRAKELVKHIVNNDITAGVTTINSVNNDGLDLKQFSRELVEYLRGLLLIKTGAGETVDLPAEDLADLKSLSAKASLGQILKAVKLFGQLQPGFDNYPTLPLELALVDCVLTPEAASAEKHAEPIPTGTQRTPALPPVAPHPHPQKPAEPAVAQSQPTRVAEPAHPSQQPKAPPQPVATPAQTPEPARAAASALQGGTEVERLKLNWKLVIEQAPQDCKRTGAAAILRSGVHPIAVDDGTVTLAFRHKNLKEQIEKAENQKIAEKIISNFLGHPCRITCIIEDNPLLKAALKAGAQRIDTEER